MRPNDGRVYDFSVVGLPEILHAAKHHSLGDHRVGTTEWGFLTGLEPGKTLEPE